MLFKTKEKIMFNSFTVALNLSAEHILRSSSLTTALKKAKSTKLNRENVKLLTVKKENFAQDQSTIVNSKFSASQKTVSKTPSASGHTRKDSTKKSSTQTGGKQKMLPLKESSQKKNQEKTTKQLNILAKRLQSNNLSALNSSLRNNMEIQMQRPPAQMKRPNQEKKSTSKVEGKLLTESSKRQRVHIETIPSVEAPRPRFNIFKATEMGEKAVKSSSSETKIKLTDACTKALIKQDIVVKNKINEKKSSRIWKY